ncbi:CvpA family protein [Barnesiella propionica]|uniref:CvpA family protein n=1 Tax=Barnesiella propionica TaxID=2981781 RepID=UPI0011C7066A|nr:CvpA family protein [Barnesiella propionica]MCU6768513.1 CvpA family protein [Barnesiella propionica]
MNYIDIAILTIVVIACIQGYIKGILRQAGALGGFLLGIVCARLFGQNAMDFLGHIVSLPSYACKVLAYFIVFLLVYLACNFIIGLVRKVTHKIQLGWMDRIGGVVFGVVRYLFVLSLVLNLLALVDPRSHLLRKEICTESQYYKPVFNMAPALFSFARDNMNEECQTEQPNKLNINRFCLFSVLMEVHENLKNDMK